MSEKGLDDLFAVVKAALADEPHDLTSAIVIAAYIEEHLTTVIRARMPGLDSELTSKLFKPDQGPISTLTAKIDVAQALDAIRHEVAHDARYIGRIRNKFAHDLTIKTFDDPKVAGLIGNLLSPRTDTTDILEREPVQPRLYDKMTNREKFLLAGMATCSSIALAA